MGSELPLFRGDRLRALRKKQGKTQGEVAEYLGYDVRQYREWETNGKLPSTPALLSLCNLFDVDTDYLLGRIDEKTHDLDFVCRYTGLTEANTEFFHNLSTAPNQYIACINTMLSSEIFIKRIVPLIISINYRKQWLSNTNSIAGERISVFSSFPDLPDNFSCGALEEVRHSLEREKVHGIQRQSEYGLPEEQDELLFRITYNSDYEISQRLGDLRLGIFDFMNAGQDLLDDMLDTKTDLLEADELIEEIARLKKKYKPLRSSTKQNYTHAGKDFIEEEQHGNDNETDE